MTDEGDRVTDARHDAADTRSEILDLVGRYYRERHARPPFDPERDAVRYGGRVFGEEEMRYLGCWNVAHLYPGAEECLRGLGAAAAEEDVVNRDISEDLFVLIEMKDLKAHEASHIDDIDSPYATNDDLKRLIMERGL